MAINTLALYSSISLFPLASPPLFDTSSGVFRHRSKAIFQGGRPNFSRGILNRVTPLNTPIEESSADRTTQPTKSYNPTLWGNYFNSFTPENEEIPINEHQILKEDVRRELLSSRNKPQDHLKLINAIEKLGVAYHFKDEIEESLAEIYHSYNTYEDDEQYDLCHDSLRFRILRQHGFYVSSDLFEKFTDENGIFSESLATDISDILSLFEASQFRVHKEEILEKALSFTTRHLTSIKVEPDNPFSEEANHALSRPLQKSLARLEVGRHIRMYQRDRLQSGALLKFAKFDFNILQSLYRKELKELTRWWEELHYADNYPYARDRLVECYFFAMTMRFEPKYSLCRMITTKFEVWMTVMDDLYDIHGTLDNLKIFTEAIERWDESCIHRLPDYMKVFYKAILDDFDQFENDLVKAGNPNYLGYLIEEVKVYTRAHFKMSKCREAKNAVKYEEYIRYGLIGAATKVFGAAMLTTMGAKVKEEDLECFSSLPNVVRSTCIISKLLNGIAGYETDKDEGGVSSVFCYMKQYGVSREVACAKLTQQVEEAWIDMNEEMCLYPRTRQRRLLYDISLSTAQISDIVYDGGEDGFRMVKNIMRDCITRTLVDPIT